MSNRQSVSLADSEATGGSDALNHRGAAASTLPRQKTRRLRVHVTLGFLITATIPGLAWGPKAMVTWGVIIFTSLFLHELGHALFGILWGSKATIFLYPLGGMTQMDPRLARRRSIVTLLAGPLLNLVLGLCIAAVRAQTGSPAWLSIAMWVNLGWGALNFLPVLPFDGGRVLLEVLGETRAAKALLISASTAVGVAISGLVAFRSLGLALVFGAAALVSFVQWNKRRRMDDENHAGLSEQLQLAKSLLTENRPREAQRVAESIIQRTRLKATERTALELLAWSFLALGQPQKAREVLLRGKPPPHTLSPYCVAAIEDASGNPKRALMWLESARQMGTLQCDALKLLIDVHARQGNLEQACQVALSELGVLAPSDVRLVLDSAFGAEQFAAATELASALARRTYCPDDVIAEAYGLVRLGQEEKSKAVLTALSPPPEDWCPRQTTRSWLRELCAHSDLADKLLDR